MAEQEREEEVLEQFLQSAFDIEGVADHGEVVGTDLGEAVGGGVDDVDGLAVAVALVGLGREGDGVGDGHGQQALSPADLGRTAHDLGFGAQVRLVCLQGRDEGAHARAGAEGAERLVADAGWREPDPAAVQGSFQRSIRIGQPPRRFSSFSTRVPRLRPQASARTAATASQPAGAARSSATSRSSFTARWATSVQ
ncbi:hypothetical protein ACFVZ3_06605 [Kitasatospora purpeofusca]|uniref:hypothetical protein n=1 Tax=Kitasatospora purpeofusca TaxID=67352 RepID=UPI0036B15567